jgi:hypothetical protein
MNARSHVKLWRKRYETIRLIFYLCSVESYFGESTNGSTSHSLGTFLNFLGNFIRVLFCRFKEMNIKKNGLLVELDPNKKYLLILDKTQFDPSQAHMLLKTLTLAKEGDIVACLAMDPEEAMRFVAVDEKVAILETDESNETEDNVEDLGGTANADSGTVEQGEDGDIPVV